MRRRRRLRMRLLWAGLLLGLVVLLAAVSALRVAVWARQETGRVLARRRPRSAFAR